MVYRGLAVAGAVVVTAVAVAVAVVLPSEPDEVVARPVTAPPAAPPSSGPAPAAVEPAPSASLPASAPAETVTPAAPAAQVTPTPGASLAPGYTAMEALYADPRVPRLTGSVRRMSLPAPSRKVTRDRRSGLAVPKLPRPWKAYGAAPFTTKQVLPKVRGSAVRGMFVTCPLPIMEQDSPRDSALLAARWTLNHHPKGARISWLASQPVKRGWLLVYRVTYGKRHSRAAVMVVDGGMRKPGLAFVTVPDAQRKQWRDIARVAAGVRVLG
ncbi:hypothetical protein MF672_029060 [Actinomadura sp. ATCC 31491]|uniref:Uncharacterized protein n=1 Tax=Actinomadura luzonensis TaxID=2805427 RepID=A0ABT0G0W1_9ACTN|nr:hypothetical protein [Actinomadura luzonensis]MCK2217815.1 hypothetical protein [Actinomadura luzonensis]